MALFVKKVVYLKGGDNNDRGNRNRNFVKPAHKDPLGFLSRLNLLCKNDESHILPTKMVFIGESISNTGERMFVYACSHAGCNFREGWVYDRKARKPHQLWRGRYQKQ